MTQTCRLVATAIPNPDHMDEMKTYMEKSSPLLASLGSGPPSRMKVTEVVNGDAMALVMVMDFPSKQELAAVFESDAYKALIPGRDRGFKTINIWITEPM